MGCGASTAQVAPSPPVTLTPSALSAPQTPTAAPTAVASAAPRKPCKYGAQCYRTGNPTHVAEYCHPGDADYCPPASAAGAATTTGAQTTPNQRTPCRYGAQCRNKNDLKHTARYSHPGDVSERMGSKLNALLPLDA